MHVYLHIGTNIPFWYLLTWVVPDKGPLNRCVCVCVYLHIGTNIRTRAVTHTHTHTHTFNGHFSRTTWVSKYQKGKTNLDFTEARYSEWQWHQLGHIQVSTSLQSNNHASTHQPLLSFSRAGCPSCHSTNDVKALHALLFCYIKNLCLLGKN